MLGYYFTYIWGSGRVQGLGFGFRVQGLRFRDYPKIRGTLFGGPYSKEFNLLGGLYWGPPIRETTVSGVLAVKDFGLIGFRV